MDKLKQLILIKEKLESKKNIEANECKIFDDSIKNKESALNKIIKYKDEYQKENVESTYKKIPALTINFFNFMKRIDKIIDSETNEINSMKNSYSRMFSRYQSTVRRYQAINLTINKSKQKILCSNENKLRNEMDEYAKLKIMETES